MGIDDTLARFPGSARTKGFVAAWTVVALMSIPVFRNSSGKQGHDYLSSEKPEAIRAGQEELRKQYRYNRDQQEAQQQSQQSQSQSRK
jgi:hypothetical protein